VKGPNVTPQGKNEETFRTFEDLEVYKKAGDFRKRMYGVARKLPDFEKYELGRQIRRASVSLTNNIAEGQGRYHYLEEIKFELQARESALSIAYRCCGSEETGKGSPMPHKRLHSLSPQPQIRSLTHHS
jgi:four helix bundle protein